MSTINSKAVQVGTSGVAAQNFTLYQPATPDGTVRLGVGNSGATTGDVVTVNSAGVTVTGTLTATTLSGSLGAATATSLTVNGNNISAVNSLGFRNRIINGDMRISQRAAGASVTEGFAVDRFEFQENGSAAFTIQRSTTVPTGFVNSTVVTVTSAASATAAQVNRYFQRIEGNNIADLGFGTATASTVTLSFWVRSSLTGTYCAALVNNAANRAYVAEYSISAANTWEYKTITIAGDTTGTWETGTSSGVQVTFDLGSGSDYNATAGSWVAANDFRTTNQANFANTSGATFYITGVQFEAGTVASPFERVEYGAMLRACQRYAYAPSATTNASTQFCYSYTFNSTTAIAVIPLPVEMRSSPSLSTAGSFQHNQTTSGGYSALAVSALAMNQASQNACSLSATISGGTSGGVGSIAATNTSAKLIFSAEL